MIVASQYQTDTVPLNIDLEQRVVAHTAEHPWLESRSPNVKRKPLEREALESGRTTSIVRFEPDSYFPEHSHPLGEEILVLEGVFSDEFGDYPAGTYIRNPPNSKHSPFSKQGCTLFVKLDQFDPEDTETVRINTRETEFSQGQGNLKVLPLHEFKGSHTALVWWPAGEVFKPHIHVGGEEVLVLQGEFKDEHGSYPQGTWLRNPHMSRHHPLVEQETLILVKVGHL